MGVILEHAICRVLQKYLSEEEVYALGFDPGKTLSQRLMSFLCVQQAVQSKSREISSLTELEAAAYAQNRFSTYIAKEGLITVFTDATERSPTFKLYPLDTKDEPIRKAWIQVWTPAKNSKDAWDSFLGRSLKALIALYMKGPLCKTSPIPIYVNRHWRA